MLKDSWVGQLRLRVLNNKAWLLVWLVFALLLSVTALVSSNYVLLTLVWAQVALATFVQVAFDFSKRLLSRVLFMLLTGFAFLTIATWYYGSNGFSEVDKFWSSLDALPSFAYEIQERGFQSWQLAEPEALVWSVQARLRSEDLGWDWRPNDRRVSQTVLADSSEGVRIFAPEEVEGAYVSRNFYFDETIEGRTFKLHLGIKSEQTESLGAYLNVIGGPRFDLPLDLDWQLFRAEWQASGESNELRVILGNIEGLTLDLRNFRLFEFKDGQWLDLGEGIGTALRLRADSSEELLFEEYIASRTWQTYTLDIPKDFVSQDAQLKTTISTGTGISLQLRSSDLNYQDDSLRAPLLIARDLRQKLWFPNENLAGHSAAALGLVLLSLLGSAAAAIWAYVMMLIAVSLTGSRTALLFAAVGGYLLIAIIFKHKKQLKNFGFFTAFLVTFAVTSYMRFGPELFTMLGLNLSQAVSRLDIWQTAWQAFLTNPLTGLNQDFASYFALQNPDTPLVMHAHNFWLDFAANYGIFGLMASLLIAGYFAYAAWTRARWTGLVLIVSILSLQLLDVSLLFSGVLIVLITGLNTLKPTQVLNKKITVTSATKSEKATLSTSTQSPKESNQTPMEAV